MIKSLLLILLFIFNVTYTIAQNELDIAECKGKIALNNQDSVLAIEHYLQVISNDFASTYNYILTITLLAHQKEYQKATTVTEHYILKGHPFNSLNNKNLNGLKESPYWNDFLLKKDSIIGVSKQQLDQGWIKLLDNMVYMDQEFRSFDITFFNDSYLNEHPYLMMTTIDSVNFNKLVKTCAEKGFPTYKSIGFNAMSNLLLLLWHHRYSYQTNPNWVKIRPFIQREIDAGNLPPSFLALFIDQYQISTNQPMIYGMLLRAYYNQPEYDQFQIQDIPNLNKRRKEIGLAPIELWLASLNQIPPKCLK